MNAGDWVVSLVKIRDWNVGKARYSDRAIRNTLFAFLVLLLTFLPMKVFAQNSIDVTTLEVANQLYENGRFTEAARAYEQLISAGIQDGLIYYNLGNAYYQQGELGWAIVNYERATRLMPRHDDVWHNLAVARGELVDQLPSDPLPMEQLAEWGRRWLTLSETAVITLLLWLVLSVIFWWWRRQRTAALVTLLGTTSVLFLFCAFLLITQLYLDENRPVAIVTVTETAVLATPNEQSPSQFTLHSGTAVHMLEFRPNWTRITLPGDGLQGWVNSDAIAGVTIK